MWIVLAEINGMPKLMCMTRLSQINLDTPIILEPMHAFPLTRPGYRCFMEFPGEETIRQFNHAPLTRPMVHGACSRLTSSACRNFASASNVFSARMCATFCGTPQARRVYRPAPAGHAAALEMHPLDIDDRVSDLRQP